MRTPVQSLASLSGLRIRHCCELWCRSQMNLGSGVAVAVGQASRYSSNSTPSLETSICCRCSNNDNNPPQTPAFGNSVQSYFPCRSPSTEVTHQDLCGALSVGLQHRHVSPPDPMRNGGVSQKGAQFRGVLQGGSGLKTGNRRHHPRYINTRYLFISLER